MQYLFTFNIKAGNLRSSSQFEEGLEIWGGWKKVWILTWLGWLPPSNLHLLPDICPHYHIIPSTCSSTNSTPIQHHRHLNLHILSCKRIPVDYLWTNKPTMMLLPSQFLYHLSSEIIVRGDRREQNRFIFSRPRKSQLYNWHFHSPRSCTVVTGTRARLNGVEKRSASLDTCCSYCFLLLSFILPILFLHFNFVRLHFILSLYSKRRGGGLNPKWFSHRKLGIFAKYVQSDSLLWPTKIILCFVISDKHIFSNHCQPSLFATDLVSSNIQTGSKVLAPLRSVQKHLSW